jgi:predicted kinase
MRRPLVLTGGPAVGKSTCARALAGAADRAAFIDVDDIRQLIVAGAAAPWDDARGAEQLLLGAANACAVARNLVSAGFEVTIADVLTPATTAVYRAELPHCLVVHLRIDITVARQRAATRPTYLSGSEFEWVYQQDVNNPPDADVVLDVDCWDEPEQIRNPHRSMEPRHGTELTEAVEPARPDVGLTCT